MKAVLAVVTAFCVGLNKYDTGTALDKYIIYEHATQSDMLRMPDALTTDGISQV